MLATVVSCAGPTSARPGDRAVITGDGRLRGWIGGRCSEPVVRREALRALAEGTPRMVRILAGEEVRQSRRRGGLTLATTCPSGGSLEVFVEPRLPRPTLVAFGDSPAARALLRLAAVAGFRSCAVHPGARPEDFEADLVLGALDLGAAAPGPDTWAVVATMGHYDEDALEAALVHPGVEVTLIASARRATAVLGALREGGLDEAALARVHTSRSRLRQGSQEEIALMALAEVVAARHRRPRPADAAGRPERAPEFATDPVCGMAVEVGPSALTAVHEETSYYFCCPGCRDRFESDPGGLAGGLAPSDAGAG